MTNLVNEYTTALHAGDVDKCIDCIERADATQKQAMQEAWNTFYNSN